MNTFKEVLTTTHETLFYPFSGADFDIITTFYKYSNGGIKKFIFCDAGIGIYDLRLDYFENSLGLNKFTIKNKETLSSTEYSDFIRSVKQFADSQSSTSQEYFGNTTCPEVVVYELDHPEFEIQQTIRLYFIKCDATAVLNYIVECLQETKARKIIQGIGLVLRYPGTERYPFLKYLEKCPYRPVFIGSNIHNELTFLNDYYFSAKQPNEQADPVVVKWISEESCIHYFKIWKAMKTSFFWSDGNNSILSKCIFNK